MVTIHCFLARIFCRSSSNLLLLLLFSGPVMSNLLWSHGLQHTRPPCPSPSPGVCPSSCPLHWWCHPTLSSSAILFSFCLQSFPELGLVNSWLIGKDPDVGENNRRVCFYQGCGPLERRAEEYLGINRVNVGVVEAKPWHQIRSLKFQELKGRPEWSQGRRGGKEPMEIRF